MSVIYAECHLCWVSLMLSVTYVDCHIWALYAECHLCWVALLLSVTYALCHLCLVSLMPSVTNKPLMLNVVMLFPWLLLNIWLNKWWFKRTFRETIREDVDTAFVDDLVVVKVSEGPGRSQLASTRFLAEPAMIFFQDVFELFVKLWTNGRESALKRALDGSTYPGEKLAPSSLCR